MKVRSFNIENVKNEYNILCFGKPDVVILNPAQVVVVEEHQYNGVREFDIYDGASDKKRKGKMFKLFLTGASRMLYVDESDVKKIEGLLQ
jgi:hypothetical protein